MDSAQFDVIFAGGGTTACVVAGRLATVDPSLKILVVEGGQHSRDEPAHVQPCRYIEHLVPDTASAAAYPELFSMHPDGCTGSVVVSCTRVVGGGSAVNGMFYVRGAASDYDGWAAFGNTGWGFNELLPLIRKFETFTPISGRSTHGYSGPIRISGGGADFGLGKQFLDVAKGYDPGRPQVDDNNDFITANAYSPVLRYVDPITGRRSDTASSYLYPHTDNSNLTVLVKKHVKRVIIKSGRAIGVEYVTDTGELTIVQARKLVVVSSGTYGSPAILERSGIGARSILERNNIPVLIDLPGVGENYMDHVGVFPEYYASSETETMNELWGNPETMAASIKEWEKSGTGKIAHTGAEAMLKVRPTEAQLRSAGPALQRRWETFFQHSPDKPMGIIVPFACSVVQRGMSAVSDRKPLTVFNYILYPESVGSVHITSGDDVTSPLHRHLDILTKASDVAQLTLLYKMSRELMRRMPAYRGEVTAFHPQFPPGSSAVCKEIDTPVAVDASDIAYTAADDEAIEKFLHGVAVSTWHPLGTCAMKPRNQAGVVDARLNVHGIEGLKVADMSICPTNVGNNTYSTALLIGEKAAAIIAEDLGYNLQDV